MRLCCLQRIAVALVASCAIAALGAMSAVAATPFVHEIADATGYVGTYCSLALDVKGTPHTSYVDVTSSVLKYATRSGGRWRNENPDGLSSSIIAGYSSIALDARGTPCISYYDQTNGNLKYVTRSGAGWVPETVDSPGDVGQYTSLALDAQGRACIAYYDVTNADLKYVSKSTGTWVIETVVSIGDMGQYASLALDALGNPRICFLDATNGDLYYGSKSGGSWFFDLVDSPGGVGRHASLALDAQGNPHISYQDFGPVDLKYARKTGGSWVVETVDTPTNVGYYTSIAIDAQGSPRISYHDGTNQDLKYASKSTGTWVIETVDAVSNVGDYSSLALDAQGNPCIAHMDFTSGDLRYADSGVHVLSPAGGERWAAGSQQTVRWSGAGNVSIELSVDGGATFSTLRPEVSGNEASILIPASTTEQALVRVRRASPLSTSESPGHFSIAPDLVNPWWTKTVSQGDVASYTSLALDALGNPRISYYENTNADLKYASRTGGVWTFETVEATGSVGSYSSLALDAQGNPRISYSQTNNGDLKYASRSGGVWTLETVDATGVVGLYTSLALDAQGNPRISYYNNTLEDLKYASKSGGVWTVETVDAVGGVGWDTSIAVDAQGNPHISYYDYTTFVLKYARKSGGVWTLESVDPFNAGWSSSIALDAQGNPCISYRGSYDGGSLRYASKAGGVWNYEIVDPGATPAHTSLALDPQGNPHISYLHPTNSDLRYASRSGGVWSIETVDAPGNTGSFSSLALDAQGNPRISYTSDGALKYASAAIELVQPSSGVTWPVGADRTVTWDGTGRVDLYLSNDGGTSWQLLQPRLTSGEYHLIVPHSPSKFSKLKLERAVPYSVSATPGFFTIETSIALLAFAAQAAPTGGADLVWASDPGPEDLAGYRIERAEEGGGASWRTLVALTRETSYHDAEGGASARYRLSAINGLGEALVLGEAALLPAAPLAAWPVPYRGGDLNVSFTIFGAVGAGGGTADVELYDLHGRLVRSLARGGFTGGQQLVTWNGRDAGGRPVADGIYFLRSRSTGIEHRLKVVVTR